MLNRTKLRRYLSALLADETVPQTADCQRGPLWENCGCPVDILDSLGESTSEDSAGLRDGVSIVLSVENSQMKLAQRNVCETTLVACIEIIVCGGLGFSRVEIADQIEERILYRLYAQPTITDTEGGIYHSPFKMARGNSPVTVKTSDDPEYDSNTLFREMKIEVETGDCVSAPCCEAVEVCFDFNALLIPPKTDPEPEPAEPAPEADE